jgi:nucleoside-diphosphate-sugar epimerase
MSGWHPLLQECARRRILILGGAGWFGRTSIALLSRFGARSLFATGGRSRQIEVDSRVIHIAKFSKLEIECFQPEIVLNFAFLTREKVASVGLEEFIDANQRLLRQFEWCARLTSVRQAVTISSGAAIATEGAPTPGDSYGILKRQEEEIALNLASGRRNVVVGRAWSVTGPYVQRPREYAFSDLVCQGLTGDPTVTATHEVWRRYCDVGEFLSVLLCLSTFENALVLDSGGPLIELRELATAVANVMGRKPVFCPADGNADRYHSTGVGWMEACADLKFSTMSIESQIRGLVSHYATQKLGSSI